MRRRPTGRVTARGLAGAAHARLSPPPAQHSALTLQGRVGNLATMHALTLQRDTSLVASPAAVPVPALTKAQLAHARTVHGGYPAEVRARIQKALRCAVTDGSVTDEMAHAVALFQHQDLVNSRREAPAPAPGEHDMQRVGPALQVTGVAGPNELSLLFPSKKGLDASRSINDYGRFTYWYILQDWDTNYSGPTAPHDRAMALVDRANTLLGAAGVPTMRIMPEMAPSPEGIVSRFHRKEWSMEVHVSELTDQLPISRRVDAATAIYHEATHAEQYWLIARALATLCPLGMDKAFMIRAKVGIEPGVAEQAAAAPPLTDPVHILLGSLWADSVETPEGKRLLNRLIPEVKRYQRLKQENAPKAVLDQATQRINALAIPYFTENPCEFHAFRAARSVGAAIDEAPNRPRGPAYSP